MATRHQTRRDSNYRQQPGLFDSPSVSGSLAGAVVGATEGHFSHTVDAPAAADATDQRPMDARSIAFLEAVADELLKRCQSDVDHGTQSRNETYAAVAADHDIARSKWLTQIVAAGRRGVTVDELSDRNDVSPNTISGRITELAREKLVVRTAQRRETRASTADRRITAAVIVATRFLTEDAPTETDRHS